MERNFKRFEGCALTIDANRNDDHKICCFKPGKPCANGLEKLAQQVAAFFDAQ